MKLSEILVSKVDKPWTETLEKTFLSEMAHGTLDPMKFRNFMLQDYMYLLDYIELLKDIKSLAENEELKDFITCVISDTENETYRVHIPAMKELGISDEDISGGIKADVIEGYMGYMRSMLEEGGILAGLTAMLQCSWNYAHIGQVLSDRYRDILPASPYKDWFDAYSCKEYIDANRAWIEALDREASDIDDEETEKLCSIFITCAEYENKFWDYLADYSV